ncbi:hypothetical protein ACHMW7_23595 [Aminobacter sp. UC22_36]
MTVKTVAAIAAQAAMAMGRAKRARVMSTTKRWAGRRWPARLTVN